MATLYKQFKEMSRTDFRRNYMGAVFENLTEEELCDLMCGGPEAEWEEDDENTERKELNE